MNRLGTAMAPSTSLGSTMIYPSTSYGVTPQSMGQIQDGRITQTIYTLIRDGKYKEVIKLITTHMDLNNSNSRAGLSLLGFSHFMLEEFENSIGCYEMLVKLFPDVDEYRLYYSQCLYKIGQFQSALRMSSSITSSILQVKVCSLQSAIKFEMNDVPGCQAIIVESPYSTDKIIDMASILFKQGKVEEALFMYTDASKIVGYDPELSYNIALCHYTQKNFPLSLAHISTILERGEKDYPELCTGFSADEINARSVGNSQALRDSFLVEAYNLKAAIEYQLKNTDGAKGTMADMPTRDEDELDSVTLHNQALVGIDANPAMSFEKLNYLLTTIDCPQGTLQNLLLLYIQFSYLDVAADLLADYRSTAESTLRFVDALLLKDSSPEEAYKQLEEIATDYIEIMRQNSKRIQEARVDHNEELLKQSTREYDDTIDKYLPIIMAQAKIYWDKEKYEVVEKIFRRSVEFCNEQESWRMNVAHTLFMQESKYKEAITFYEPLIRKNHDSILDVSAIVLANICVSYIMTGKNEQAEDLMKHIEQEEERQALDYPEKNFYHFCIVNLVLGTLYCAKGNSEFGISRVMKSMEPFNKKLGTETWFYAKRCILSLLDSLSKHMIVIKDAFMAEILVFLDECAVHGKNIPVTTDPESIASMNMTTNTIAYEARLLKSFYLRI